MGQGGRKSGRKVSTGRGAPPEAARSACPATPASRDRPSVGPRRSAESAVAVPLSRATPPGPPRSFASAAQAQGGSGGYRSGSGSDSNAANTGTVSVRANLAAAAFLRACAADHREHRLSRSAAATSTARSPDRRHYSGGRASSATRSGHAFHRPGSSVSTRTRRDLPMPGSPPSNTTWPWPAVTCSQRLCRNATSSSRPTNGVSPTRSLPPGGCGLRSRRDLVDLHGRGETLQRVDTEVTVVEQSRDQPMRSGTDHHGVGLSQPLKAGRKVGRLPQREQFALASIADLAHDDQPRMNTDADLNVRCASGESTFRALFTLTGHECGGSGRFCNTLMISSPARTARGHRLRGPGDTRNRPAAHRPDTARQAPRSGG